MPKHQETNNRPTADQTQQKLCEQCNTYKPLSHFLRRTGKGTRRGARRGTCRECRKRNQQPAGAGGSSGTPTEQSPVRRTTRGARPALPRALDRAPLPLTPTRNGTVRMRGKSDKGRRWIQETDLDTALTLVKEHAAVIVNRHTIRRLFTNRSFRSYILNRDQYTCHFCGQFGDTIDHLLPRAKGGHTTPVNCVCACNECNQSKADRDLDEFMDSL